MHPSAFNFMTRISRIIRLGPETLEIGSRNVNGTVRPLFMSRHYLGIDVCEGKGVDVVADGATYHRFDGFDQILCCEVLEHAANAEAICRNANKLLFTGSPFIVTCACTERAAHSAIDGGPLRQGEFYRNVSEADLRLWLSDFRVVLIDFGVDKQDIYALAIK